MGTGRIEVRVSMYVGESEAHAMYVVRS
jgi:hypothetical protein